MATSEERIDEMGFTEVGVHQGGKRLGLRWCTWMGDWFTSWSPRNDNSNAEGPWDQWVDLALHILRDPMTAHVRPAAHVAVADVVPLGLYGEAQTPLTYDQLAARFAADVERDEKERQP